MTLKNLGVVVLFILVVEITGALGAIFTTPKIATWYVGLKKPAWTPPNWVFGPVWTTLFALMGISLYVVYRNATPEAWRTALIVFIVQMVLNVAWSLVFFGAESLFGGVALIACLWVAILYTIVTFARISSIAGWLLVPYIAWVSLASVLNYTVWLLNR